MCATIEQFGLVEVVDGFGQRVVETVASAAHSGIDLRLGEPIAVANADGLRTPVGAMDHADQESVRSLQVLQAGPHNRLASHKLVLWERGFRTSDRPGFGAETRAKERALFFHPAV